jgi:hypothetical protein
MKLLKYKPLSFLLESVDSPRGRRRVADYLKSQPFPRYERVPHRRGFLTRVDANGTRTVGQFIRRHFTAAR